MHKLYDHGVYVFAVGDRTVPERVPTSGKAVYSGLSTLASGGGSSFDYSVAGTATFNVDFGKKDIAGTVEGRDRVKYAIPLVGKINGNAFSGIKNGVDMHGHFYGPNAEELGGVFKGRTTINGIADTPVMGSFGAKKDYSEPK